MIRDDILRQRLERARQKLYILQAKHGFSHASVLRQSMILDKLINQYNRLFYVRILQNPEVKEKKPTA
ncbi:aspartyl-phosphate phosphatase Spo0E family protein [Paenibacillus sp. FSL R10-2782]|uniref:Spo0E family sporulation regulatory protein-aspartic acid phosphatase n=1 Tax=Paenibacillus terrae TaxID=159743 RepID=A0A4U2Q2R9_9BACL|nr:aspartyl-phosphate phosphatase Spo0E family protein [Paenibacillus terrae]TKH43864.1 Spo0E family sporulation regulatory protein-aspartic acid phosphatase [Paenibacillus terrae]